MVTMTDPEDYNAQVIARFRANQGDIDGAPFILVHHRGRRTGRDYLAPMVYLADEQEADLFYVFASKAGAPANPDWYNNLMAAGQAEVEIGPETFTVSVTELHGAERDRIYAAQVAVMPNFAEYETKVAGIRTIPVLALRRVR